MNSVTKETPTLSLQEQLCSSISRTLDQLRTVYGTSVSLDSDTIQKIVNAILERQQCANFCSLPSQEFSRKVDLFQNEAIIRLTRVKEGDLKLGNGSYKTTKLGIRVNTETAETMPVALAVMKKKDHEPFSETELNSILKQANQYHEICERLPGVAVRLHKAYLSTAKPKITLVEELGRQNLDLSNIASASNTLKECFAKQMIHAVASLHDNGVWHRDLKPHNFLLMLDGTVKVIDFDLASSTQTSSHTFCGSLYFIAPELYAASFPDVNLDVHPDTKTDIWALGCSLFKIFTGTYLIEILLQLTNTDPPQKSLQEDQIFTLIRQRYCDNALYAKIQEIIDRSSLIPAKYRKILEGCLQPDPRHRLSAKEVKSLLSKEEEKEIWKCIPTPPQAEACSSPSPKKTIPLPLQEKDSEHDPTARDTQALG